MLDQILVGIFSQVEKVKIALPGMKKICLYLLSIIFLLACQQNHVEPVKQKPTGVIMNEIRPATAEAEEVHEKLPMCTKKIRKNCWIPTEEINTETPEEDSCLDADAPRCSANSPAYPNHKHSLKKKHK